MHSCNVANTQSITGKEKSKLNQKPLRGSPDRAVIQDWYHTLQISPDSKAVRDPCHVLAGTATEPDYAQN